ncbi:MAG: hypothetical protein PWP46_111, partial [Fusobacteriaceae bacterium]|nr:hypothetical protein [Fusobacteriales bacterium]MDN5303232.1 hypothetical protein [Fusobacteriaceae bacterium]
IRFTRHVYSSIFYFLYIISCPSFFCIIYYNLSKMSYFFTLNLINFLISPLATYFFKDKKVSKKSSRWFLRILNNETTGFTRDYTLDFFVTNYTNELEFFVTQRARRKPLRTTKFLSLWFCFLPLCSSCNAFIKKI